MGEDGASVRELAPPVGILRTDAEAQVGQAGQGHERECDVDKEVRPHDRRDVRQDMHGEDTRTGQAQDARGLDIRLGLLRERGRADHTHVRGSKQHDKHADRHPIAATDHARDDDREERDGKRQEHLTRARHAGVPQTAAPRRAHSEKQTGHHRAHGDDDRAHNRGARTGNRQGENITPHLVGAQQVPGGTRRAHTEGQGLVQRAGNQHRRNNHADRDSDQNDHGQDHRAGDLACGGANASSQGAWRKRQRHQAPLPSPIV